MMRQTTPSFSDYRPCVFLGEDGSRHVAELPTVPHPEPAVVAVVHPAPHGGTRERERAAGRIAALAKEAGAMWLLDHRRWDPRSDGGTYIALAFLFPDSLRQVEGGWTLQHRMSFPALEAVKKLDKLGLAKTFGMSPARVVELAARAAITDDLAEAHRLAHLMMTLDATVSAEQQGMDPRFEVLALAVTDALCPHSGISRLAEVWPLYDSYVAQNLMNGYPGISASEDRLRQLVLRLLQSGMPPERVEATARELTERT